ncbi:kinase suppressor of Ras 2-like, partial [Leptonychotes weddellii]
MSQTCTVCGKGMLFGLKCKNCKLKCHNKCTKEAPPCHLLIIHRGARLVRTESVPCDINNPLRKPPRYSDLHISQTLPKTNKISK